MLAAEGEIFCWLRVHLLRLYVVWNQKDGLLSYLRSRN